MKLVATGFAFVIVLGVQQGALADFTIHPPRGGGPSCMQKCSKICKNKTRAVL
jgi:hypothetical protein